MQSRIERKSARYAFDSLAELGRYIDDTPRTWVGANMSTRGRPEKSWDLNATFDDAVRMAKAGWIEGAQRSQRALKALDSATPQPIDRVDFYGHRPHVARYCAGAPDNMIRRANPLSGGDNVITLYVAVNALAYVRAEYMANFGLAVAHYIRQLELGEGKRVELHGAICSTVSGWRVAHTWKIKDAGQPLDLAVLAFSIGHPAMFRRLGFGLRERCAAPRDYGYGSTVSLLHSDLINPPAGAIILNGMANADRYARTIEAGTEYVEQQISKAKKG